MPTKKELQDKSEQRLKIVKGHFFRKEYDATVENSGYIIEFGLKAAICKHENITDYPIDKKYYTHDLNKLVRHANLQDSLSDKKANSVDFFTNWSLISKWSPEFRYQPIGTNSKEYTKQIVNAIDNKSEGVYPWVKTNW